MGVVSVRELNGNVSKVIARVQAGETVDIAKDGVVVAEMRPKPAKWLDDPVRREAFERLKAGLAEGIPGLTGPATYEERTE